MPYKPMNAALSNRPFSGPDWIFERKLDGERCGAHEQEIRDALHEHFTAEVTNISKHGFWLLVDDRELFLSFEHFPWFKHATIDEILNLERPAPQHLRWPDLDVDLGVDSIEHPERYPLKSKL